MTFIIKILNLILDIIYFFLKLFKTKNKITLISRQNNKPTQDIEILANELTKEMPKYKVIILSKKLESGLLNKIKYAFHMLKQMYHIATSKVVILDSYCIVISLLHHKKNLKVIQMWHGIGLLKKAGYSILGKEEGRSIKIATLMKMHKNYDYIFASAESCRKSISEVFNESIDKVVVYPLPRINLLIDKKYQSETKEKIYLQYPDIKNKKNIVYVPTYRKDNEELINAIDKLVESIDYKKYNLIIKLHPLTEYNKEIKNAIIDKEFSTTEMLFIADYVIADYSTVIFEAAILNKPLFFYTYDMKEYAKKRDFFIDYEKEMPGIITDSAKAIMNNIKSNNFDLKKIKKFSEKYIEIKGNPTKNICSFIKRIIGEEE